MQQQLLSTINNNTEKFRYAELTSCSTGSQILFGIKKASRKAGKEIQTPKKGLMAGYFSKFFNIFSVMQF